MKRAEAKKRDSRVILIDLLHSSTFPHDPPLRTSHFPVLSRDACLVEGHEEIRGARGEGTRAPAVSEVKRGANRAEPSGLAVGGSNAINGLTADWNSSRWLEFWLERERGGREESMNENNEMKKCDGRSVKRERWSVVGERSVTRERATWWYLIYRDNLPNLCFIAKSFLQRLLIKIHWFLLWIFLKFFWSITETEKGYGK